VVGILVVLFIRQLPTNFLIYLQKIDKLRNNL
jgi:hypothetical protein